MKKRITKTIACFLALSLLCTAFLLPASAREAGHYGRHNILTVDPEIWAKKDDTIYPTIVIPGIAMSYSYLADEDGNPVRDAEGRELGGGLLIIDGTTVNAILLKNLLPALLMSLFLQVPGNILQAAANTMKEILAIQSCNIDGTPKNNLKTEFLDGPVSGMTESRKDSFYREAPIRAFVEEIGEENIYYFNYNVIGDPMDIGRALHEYIQMVKQQSGMEKVNLLSLSLGGTILTAYLDLEESSPETDLHRIVNAVAVLDGTEIISDFFSRNFNLEDDFIFQEFAPLMMRELGADPILGNLVNILFHALPRLAFENFLTGMVDGMMEGILLYNPLFWSMVESKKYDGLAERYLSAPEFAVLRAKTDRFQQARLNLVENLKDLNENYGVGVYNLSAYNLRFDYGAYSFFAIMDSSRGTNSDAVNHLASTSLGATYVPVGQKLDAAYLASRDPKYISPNQSVDASTCAFPDTTWFCQDQHHEAAGNDSALVMLLYIVIGAIDDIHSEPEKFPQFNLGRDVKNLTRNLIPQAEALLNDRAACPNAADTQFAALEQALDGALAMLKITNVYGAPDCEAVEATLREAINAVLGVQSSEGPGVESLLVRILKFLDAFLYRIVGARGFSDWMRSWFGIQP